MSDSRERTHEAAAALVENLTPLDALLTRGDRRRLAREGCDWYLDAHARGATRNGTCMVVTAGPPGAGKTSTLRDAVGDLDTRLVIDPDLTKEFLARWCLSSGMYEEALRTRLPDGRPVMPLDLSPVLQTMSTEVCNAARRVAVERGTDIVVEGTMATPAYGGTVMTTATLMEYDNGRLTSVDAKPPRALGCETRSDRWTPLMMQHPPSLDRP